jgi:hypothetical protein
VADEPRRSSVAGKSACSSMGALMPGPGFQVRVRVWLYEGMGGWHFVTLPKKQSQGIRRMFAPMRRGWGSVPVLATIGKTSWKTSIFPDSKAGAYLLPLKAGVRKAEKIVAGDTIRLSLQIRVP